MSLSVDFLSILLFVTLFQGVFIASILVVRYKLRPQSNIFLFAMVFAIMWLQAEFLSVRLPLHVNFDLFYGTRYGSWLLLGPLFYLYVKSVVAPPLHAGKNLAHFAPVILFTILLPITLPKFLSEGQVNYGMLSSFYPFVEDVTILQKVYSFVYVVQYVHLITYLIVSFSLIRLYGNALKGAYSTVMITDLLWLRTLNALLIIVVILTTVFLTLFFTLRIYNRNLDYLYVLPMTIVVYLVSYRLAGVGWLPRPAEEKKATRYEKSSLKESLAKAYVEKLEHVMTTQKPFLNNELRLQDLSDLVEINPHHLSQVINEQLHTTFYDYVNQYRTSEACDLIKTLPSATLLNIAFQSGFNNKTSFNNAFRRFTGTTASKYRQKVIRENSARKNQ